MQKARRDSVHNKRIPVLQPCANLKRRRSRGYNSCERERVEDRVDEYEQELGTELAVQCPSCWSISLFPCHW